MPHLPVVRDRSDARVAGVCAALARAWQVEPLVVRASFVILAVLTNGFVVAAYLALWALIPERGSTTEPVRRLLPFTRSWSTSTLVAVVAVAAALGGTLATGAGPGSLVVILLAWLILRYGLSRRGASAHPGGTEAHPPSTPFERLSAQWQQRLDNVDAGRPADWVPDLDHLERALHLPSPEVTRPAPAGRRRGLRTWLTILALLAVAWAGLGVAGQLGVMIPDLAWVSSALAVFGVALVAVARPSRAAWGRPPMLLPVTLLTAVAVLPLLNAAATPDTPAPAMPVVVGAHEGEHALPVGDHRIDLAGRPLTADSRVSYRLDAGEVVLVLPETGNVVVHARVDLGTITTPGDDEEGFNAATTWSRVTDPTAPTLTVDVAVRLGTIEVQR